MTRARGSSGGGYFGAVGVTGAFGDGGAFGTGGAFEATGFSAYGAFGAP